MYASCAGTIVVVRRSGVVVVAVELVVVAALVIVKVSTGGGKPKSGTTASTAAAAVIREVTTVSPAVADAVGTGSATAAPKAISGAPALTENGLPRIFYAGAEYCPFCAAERWPLVVALSRFGTFTGLGQTR